MINRVIKHRKRRESTSSPRETALGCRAHTACSECTATHANRRANVTNSSCVRSAQLASFSTRERELQRACIGTSLRHLIGQYLRRAIAAVSRTTTYANKSTLLAGYLYELFCDPSFFNPSVHWSAARDKERFSSW